MTSSSGVPPTRRRRPQGDLAVAVLADDRRVHAADPRLRAARPGDGAAGTCRARCRCRSPRRWPPSQLLRNEGDDVDRVRHQQDQAQTARRRGSAATPAERAPTLAAASSSRPLARPLLPPTATTNEIGIAAHRDVTATGDSATADELQAVAQVQHLGLGPGGVHVVQRDLVGDPGRSRWRRRPPCRRSRRPRPKPPCPTRPSGPPRPGRRSRSTVRRGTDGAGGRPASPSTGDRGHGTRR